MFIWRHLFTVNSPYCRWGCADKSYRGISKFTAYHVLRLSMRPQGEAVMANNPPSLGIQYKSDPDTAMELFMQSISD